MQAEGRDFWPLCIVFLTLAIGANEVEIITFCFLDFDAMTFGVLPNVAFFAGNAVGTVIQIFTVHSADGTVKDPFVFFFGKSLELLLAAFHLRL